MTSLPGHFRSHGVAWGHFLSRDCHLLQVTALQELKRTINLDYRPSKATSRWLPVKWRHFQVTSGHVVSRKVISCHVNATFCELRPVEGRTYPNLLIGLLQSLPGHFRSNDVSSGSLPVTWGHVRSFPVTWLTPLAS